MATLPRQPGQREQYGQFAHVCTPSKNRKTCSNDLECHTPRFSCTQLFCEVCNRANGSPVRFRVASRCTWFPWHFPVPRPGSASNGHRGIRMIRQACPRNGAEAAAVQSSLRAKMTNTRKTNRHPKTQTQARALFYPSARLRAHPRGEILISGWDKCSFQHLPPLETLITQSLVCHSGGRAQKFVRTLANVPCTFAFCGRPPHEAFVPPVNP